ncbi:MAG: hypothetical protein M1827_007216 [Pycnora praestabilis]|nr:MAG: hypothetical protein M1827_007216 [Pycnora praestabilis]
MWKSKRNVRITYTPLPHSSTTSSSTAKPSEAAAVIKEGGAGGGSGGEAGQSVLGGVGEDTDRLDDLVTYQGLTSSKVKTVAGIDKASGLGAWDWRGKGLLAIATSHWEVLGYGPSSPHPVAEGGAEEWVVTYFAKTLFTPAGIDVYARTAEGLSEEVVEGIREALGKMEDNGLRELAGGMFEIKRDGERDG